MKKILRGFRWEETSHFIAFRSHWRFSSEFCTPEEAYEKGGIEGEAGAAVHQQTNNRAGASGGKNGELEDRR